MTLTVVDGGLDYWGEPVSNGGYWEPDGITYSSCTRCGINMALPDDQTLRSYCVDCNYPEFRAPFEAGSAVKYLSVVAA